MSTQRPGPSHREAPRAVIFDFGGVVSQPLGPALGEIESEFAIPAGTLMRLFYGTELWQTAEVGGITYAEYITGCQAALQEFVGGADRARSVWERWYAAFYQPTFMPGVLDIVEALQGRVRVAMLSNASDGMEERMREQFKIAHLFDPLINSATIRVAKPDERAFTITLERLGLAAAECFFTDDTLVNITAAKGLGIRSHHFQDEEGLRRAIAAEGITL